MGRQRLASESGQTQAEYVLVVAGIAIACIAAALILGAEWAVRLVGEAVRPRNRHIHPSEPNPRSSSTATRVDQCENGGWQSYPQFADEQECLDYLENLAP